MFSFIFPLLKQDRYHSFMETFESLRETTSRGETNFSILNIISEKKFHRRQFHFVFPTCLNLNINEQLDGRRVHLQFERFLTLNKQFISEFLTADSLIRSQRTGSTYNQYLGL